MSLIRQLWIAVILMMSIAFISSFTISIYKAKDYFEQQLLLKNIDNANSLALTLSQINKDPVTLELLIAAQFDTGHYQRIELIDPEGKPLQQRFFEGNTALGMPSWFQQFASLRIEPGVAQVQDGWFQYGTLYVESHTRFAYQALWATTRDLFIWFLIVSAGAGILGTLILKYITRPLEDVVSQAEAIGDRRFITSQEPRTLEFGRVVKAMNILTGRIKSMLDIERQRLEDLRYKNQHDSLTGLANRDFFMSLLDTALQNDDTHSRHELIILRVKYLADINHKIGHKQTDAMLQKIAALMTQFKIQYFNQFSAIELGRLNGSDFALLLTDITNTEELKNDLVKQVIDTTSPFHETIQIAISAVGFHPGEVKSVLLMQADSQLASAEQKEVTCIESSEATANSLTFNNADQWRNELANAIQSKSISFDLFPVASVEDLIFHREVMMRVNIDGEVCTAGKFLPWARRLDLLKELELLLVEMVFEKLESHTISAPVAINISRELLFDTVSINKLYSIIATHLSVASNVAFEIPESAVVRSLDHFAEFCTHVHAYGCQVGIEHAGAEFAKISNLQEFGLSYIKIDQSFINGVCENRTSQDFLKGVAFLGHSIGIKVIAEGVSSQEDYRVVKELGLDGMTGPAITI